MKKVIKASKAQTNLFDEIIVDNFAGGGGASVGIELAIGKPVTIAVNHDPDAISMHQANHPYTKHYCESVWNIDPMEACAGRKVALAWFSPDCKHFSKAKGGTPVSKQIRGLAWIVLRWAGTVRPRVIMLENVEEFQTWGPVRRGRPVKAHKGETFRRWKSQLEELGYTIEHRELRACDYGVPTIRKRFYLIARCDGQPIVWTEATHGDPKSEAAKRGQLLPWHTAAECIDFTLPCPSIFGRKKPLVDNTMKRIAKGLDKFVVNNPEPFIVQVNHSGGFRGQSVDEPLQTITAKHGYALTEPQMTPYVVQCKFNNMPQTVRQPIGTITAVNSHLLTAPVMVPIGYGERKGQQPRVNSVQEPLSTIVSSGKQYLAAPSLIQYHSETAAGEVRGQSVADPMLTIDTQPRYALNVPFISKYYGGVVGAEVTEPTPTVTAIDHNALTAAHLIEYYGNALDGISCHDPMHTITPCQREAVIESHLCVLRNNMDCRDWREPMPTVTTSAGHFAEVRTIISKMQPRDDLANWPLVRDLLNHHCGYNLATDEILLFWLGGYWYYISDIGLRMLTPRELYRAQGFPIDYKIEFKYNGKPYSKAAQVARCGNSVSPMMATALVRANLPEYCVWDITTVAQLLERVAV